MKQSILFRRSTLMALLITAGCISSNALAATTGWYAGANLGYDTGSIEGNQNYHAVGDGAAYSIDDTLNYKHALSDYLFGVQFGYDRMLSKQFVLGAEVFSTYSKANANWSSSLNANNRQFEKHYTYGASLLPGWQLDDQNRLFARVGWAQSQFNHTTNDQTSFGPNFSDKTKNALETGLGWMTQLTAHLALRLEYDHFNYSSLKTQNSAYVNSSNETVNGTYSYKPDFDQFTLGLNYYFAEKNTPVGANNLVLKTQGWYIGAATGRDMTEFRTSTKISNVTIDYSYALTGYLGTLDLGYRWRLSSAFNLGLESFAQLNSSKMDYYNYNNLDGTITNPIFKFRQKSGYGLSLLPGYQVTPSGLTYLRLGVIDSKFEKTGSQGTTTGSNFSVDRTGVQFGLGYEQALSTAWSLRGEYAHSIYKVIDANFGASTFHYKPEDNQYTIGVAHHF